MSLVVDILIGLLLILGAGFCFVAAIGVQRLPDVYSRMHAASKVGTLGSGLLLLAVGFYSGEFAVAIRAIAGFTFFLLTAPVAAHLLGRAAMLRGYETAPGTWRNDMAHRMGEGVAAPSATPESVRRPV